MTADIKLFCVSCAVPEWRIPIGASFIGSKLDQSDQLIHVHRTCSVCSVLAAAGGRSDLGVSSVLSAVIVSLWCTPRPDGNSTVD